MTSGKLAGRMRLLLAVALLAQTQSVFGQDNSGPHPAELIDPVAPGTAPSVLPPPMTPPPFAPTPPPFAPSAPAVPPASTVPSSLSPPASSSGFVPTPYAPPPSSFISSPYTPTQSSSAASSSFTPTPYVPPSPSFVPTPYVPPSPASSPAFLAPPSDPWTERIWFGTDYLMWWTKGASAPPLVTRGSPAAFNPGALGEHGTQVLFGGSPLDPGMFSGLRLNGGFWLTDNLGIEGSFFSLFQRSVTFNAGSDPNGYPVIARPVFDVLSGVESSYVDSYPGLVTGGTSENFSSLLRGFELSVAARAVDEDGLSVDGFLGYRQLNLNESLVLQDNLAALQPGFLTFAGGPADPPTSLSDFDSFVTSNTFYGPQFGTRLNWNVNRWNINLLGKFAMGVSQQVVTINGATTLNTPGAAPVTTTGGILAQSTNIGRYFSDQFAVVPEFGLNLGYQITPSLQIKFGYTFLFWSNVARPGDQIDRRVNASYVPTDVRFGTTGGPATPTFNFVHSDYWAQGLNIGLEFRK